MRESTPTQPLSVLVPEQDTSPSAEQAAEPIASSSRVRLLIIFTALLAVVLTVGGTLGYRIWDAEHQADDAMREANALAAQEASSDEALASEIATATQVAEAAKGSVADAGTLTALTKAIDAAETALEASARTVTDGVTLDTAREVIAANQAVLDGNAEAIAALEAAEDAVTASHDQFLLDAATAAAGAATSDLAVAVAAAEQRLAESEGQVDDDAVRQSLHDVLEAAKVISATAPAATADAQNAQAAAAADAKAKIDSAVTAVNDAVTARADRIAAEQAAAEQAAAEQAAAEQAAAEQAAASSGGRTTPCGAGEDYVGGGVDSNGTRTYVCVPHVNLGLDPDVVWSGYCPGNPTMLTFRASKGWTAVSARDWLATNCG